ncbi:MAG: glycosyltransferase family 39 protein [Bacteroidales bacterium]|nr:glycosyltransferase family 39 protein [Bacteroidales bacterium]
MNKQNYTITAQLKGLFSSTQLTPLHYSFLIFWQRIVGDDYFDFRLFGVFIFILTLPFFFLLAKILYKSNLAGWVAVSMYAVSPYINLFSQEARYYILWSFFLIVLHYLLLQVIQHKSIRWWITYSLIAVFAMYTSPFSGIIIFGHFIYIWFFKKDLRLVYNINLLFIFVAYLPWIYSIFIHRGEIFSSLSWHSIDQSVPFWMPLMGQILYMISIFVSKLDYFEAFDQPSDNLPHGLLCAFILNLLVLTLLVISFIYLFRKSKKETNYFLLLIILPGFILFYMLDITRNGITSWWWRYFIFTSAGIFLVVTYFFFKKIEQGNLFYSAIYVGLVIMGIISILAISKSRNWYIGRQQVYIEDAHLISKAEKPLLITDYAFRTGMVDFMVVLIECKSENVDILRADPDIENMEEKLSHKDYAEIYVIHASEKLVENLKSQFGEKMEALKVEGISPMWQININ